MNAAEIEQVSDEMLDAANGSTLDHVDQFRIALRGFADRISDALGEDDERYVVVYVDYGESCDGYPGVLGIYGTLADAAQDMLSDIRDKEAENSGYCMTRYSTTSGELWYNETKTHGCRWKIVKKGWKAEA